MSVSNPVSDNTEDDLFTDEDSYLIKSFTENNSNEFQVQLDKSFNINAVFDGNKRMMCEFKIDISSDKEVDPERDKDLSSNYAQNCLIHNSTYDESSCLKSHEKAKLMIQKIEPYPPNQDVTVQDRIIISKSEDDDIYRLLRTDQEVHSNLLNGCKTRVQNILNTGILEKIQEKELTRKKWKDFEKVYIKQRVWKKVGTSVCRGIKDHTKDFNAREDMIIPASWTIEVAGRPPKVEDLEDEVHQHLNYVMLCLGYVLILL
jgi:hypothetical protein